MATGDYAVQSVAGEQQGVDPLEGEIEHVGVGNGGPATDDAGELGARRVPTGLFGREQPGLHLLPGPVVVPGQEPGGLAEGVNARVADVDDQQGLVVDERCGEGRAAGTQGVAVHGALGPAHQLADPAGASGPVGLLEQRLGLGLQERERALGSHLAAGASSHAVGDAEQQLATGQAAGDGAVLVHGALPTAQAVLRERPVRA